MKSMRTAGTLNDTISSVVRISLIVLALLVQVTFMVVLTVYLRVYAAPIYAALDIAALVMVISLLNSYDSTSYRMAWIILVLLMPIFGMFLYLAWGRVDFNRRERGHLKKAFETGFDHMPSSDRTLAHLREIYPECAPYSGTLLHARYALFENTDAQYFPVGEQYFEQLIADMAAARESIYLEFFIVAAGELWDKVHTLLLEKIREGVEVRLLYDDVGCFFKLPRHFNKILREEGFQVEVFSPAHRFLSSFYLNYRNHQKIALIDGRIAYTGGVNIADEYVNIGSRLGHWKDVGIRLTGDAVVGLQVIFLQMWNLTTKNRNIEKDWPAALPERGRDYRPDKGFFQPYADGPSNNPSNPALDLIQQSIAGAREYIWFTSPYLVIDQELSAAFCRAAASGVEVRILTPAVCDHWYVGILARHQYKHLLENGVKIYEYSPGFIHGKLMLADDKWGTVGSVNLDFRSLFLHYENGVYICGAPVLEDIKRDIQETIALSREMTLEDVNRRPLGQKILGSLFTIVSPLL